jgi:predicted SnoaL-like aldol condensation-catalyzing enzyme
MSATDPLQRNKEAVVSFYKLMFNDCRPADAIRLYAGRHAIPSTTACRRRQGRLHRLLRAHGQRVPGQAVTIKRVLAEGNFVVLHCHQQWPTDANRDWAGIDIFRLTATARSSSTGMCCR